MSRKGKAPSQAPATRARVIRVLFVEDDEADVELAVQVLRQGGFQADVDVVKTPEELTTQLRSGSHDVVLADYRLPRWTGLDALNVLREQGSDLPFILVTGS